MTGSARVPRWVRAAGADGAGSASDASALADLCGSAARAYEVPPASRRSPGAKRASGPTRPSARTLVVIRQPVPAGQILSCSRPLPWLRDRHAPRQRFNLKTTLPLARHILHRNGARPSGIPLIAARDVPLVDDSAAPTSCAGAAPADAKGATRTRAGSAVTVRSPPCRTFGSCVAPCRPSGACCSRPRWP